MCSQGKGWSRLSVAWKSIFLKYALPLSAQVGPLAEPWHTLLSRAVAPAGWLHKALGGKFLITPSKRGLKYTNESVLPLVLDCNLYSHVF